MTEIAIREPSAPAVVSDLDSWTQIAGQVIKLANEIYDTPFVPDGLRGSVPATAAAILAGRELGLGPMTSLANVHVIKGKPSLSAALMRALILAQGHQIETVSITDTRVVLRGRRKGEATWEEASFTADQAKHARIDLGGYPQDKLYARATSRLARRKFADVIAGMPYSAEELEDGEADEGAVTDPGPGAIEAPKTAARTARRASAKAPERPVAAVPDSGPAAVTGSALPPLPGEDEDGPAPSGQPAGQEPAAGPSLASSGQAGIIARHFQRLGFTDDERPQRLAITATIAGCDEVSSTKDLTQEQAKTVADTLSRCKDRDRLIALMVDGEKQGTDG